MLYSIFLLLGAGIWALSVAAKFKISKLFFATFDARANSSICSTMWGLISALTELVPAALFFLLWEEASWGHILAFGLGAGTCEALWLLSKTGGVPLFQVHWLFWAERGATLLLHVGTRGLLWLGLMNSSWLALVGLTFFSIADGIATYGTLLKWKWEGITIIALLSLVALMGTASTVLFIVLS